MCLGILEDQAKTAGEPVYGLCASMGGPSSMFTNTDCMLGSQRESLRMAEEGRQMWKQKRRIERAA